MNASLIVRVLLLALFGLYQLLRKYQTLQLLNVPLFPPANFFTVFICQFTTDQAVYSWVDGSDWTELYSKCAVRPKRGPPYMIL